MDAILRFFQTEHSFNFWIHLYDSERQESKRAIR